MITVICPWYLNTAIVGCQLSSWNALPDFLKDQTRFILVDDGSPVKMPEPDVDLNCTMARIKQDIAWNQPGARNLGAHLADTEYLFFTDIDHEITARALQQAIEKDKDRNTVYMFQRRFNGKSHHPHPCSFVISKAAFDRIGGFDEDFAGHRGHDDTMFKLLIDRYLKRETIHADLILHADGLTPGLNRDHSRNTLLLQFKKQLLSAGTYTNGKTLRFEWEIVYAIRRQ
jgi:Glycosyl transferase family 2